MVSVLSRFLRIHYVLPAVVVVSVTLRAQGSSGANEGSIRGRVTVSRPDDITEEILHGRMLNRYELTPGLSDKPLQPYSLSEKAVVYLE